MSSLSDVLVLPLNALGTKIGLPSLGSWVNTFINAINQGEVNEQVLSDLQQIQSSLEQLDTALSSISSQISSFESLFQETSVAQYTTTISSYYEDIQGIAATKVSTAADMANIQARMVAIGNNIINDSSGILNNVNEIAALLISNAQVSPGLINNKNSQMIASNEFFSYYVGVQSIAVNYYKYYAMALFCVNWAIALNERNLISFPEGQSWISQINSNINNLQNFLDDNIPSTVTTLVQALASGGGQSASVAISTTSAPLCYLWFVTEVGDYSQGWFTAPNPVLATLSAAMDISNPTANTQYRFALSFASGGEPLYMLPSGAGYPSIFSGSVDTSSYQIWATANGSFVFDFYDNCYLGQPCMNAGVSALDQGGGECSLGSATTYDVGDPSQMLTLAVLTTPPPPWIMPTWSTTQLQILSRSQAGFWSNTGLVPGAFTVGKNLALADFNGCLYAAWRGTGNDQAVHVQSLTPASGAWSGVGTIPAAFSTVGWIGAAAFNGCLYVAWRGTGTDSAIYYASLNAGGNWSSLSTVPKADGTDTGPTLAVFNDQLYFFWQGVNGDARVYYSAMTTTGSWSGVALIPGANTSTGGIASAVFNGQLYAAWRGVGSDAAVYYASYPGSASSWTPLATIPSANSDTWPALASFNGGLLAVWQGANGDRSAHLSMMNGSGVWTGQGTVPSVSTGTGCMVAPCGADLYFGLIWPS